MAAGQGFKTFTTGEVLTAADVNGYLMQGVLVFASEAARDAAITSPQEGQFAYTKDNNSLWYYTGSAWAASGATGDIEGVTAGVGISGGGTSGTVTITNSMATEITASGDIIVGTGSSTFDNLPIGTTGQVLTADTTVSPYKVKWATPSSGTPTFVGVSVYRAAPDQAIPTATWTAINWTAENYDTDGFHDNATNNTRLTIPTGKSGYYQIRSQVGMQATSGEFNLRVRKNGSTDLRFIIGSGASNDNSMQVNFAASLSAGDYLDLSVYQTSGSNKNVFQGTLYCWFELNYLGA